jgi:hypothetical protein
MAKVLDDLATRFMSFSDALESQFGDLSIDFSLPSKTLKGSNAGAGTTDPAGDARALSAAAKEREAAKQRGEEILQQLPPGYFESSFDALKHELCQMGPDAQQDDIDVVVDRLTAAMEVSTWAFAVPAAPCCSACCAIQWLVPALLVTDSPQGQATCKNQSHIDTGHVACME